jgi:ERCC4-type nuclease
VKREYTILVDEREKKPFTFPEYIVCLDPNKDPCHQSGITVRLRTQKRTMKTGDYALDGGAAVVERKGSLDEITQNLLTPDGRRRFAECCRRLRDETARPLLLLEGLVGTPIIKPGKPHPGLAIDSLMRILQEYAIGLIVLPTSTAGQRRAAGEWAARWLITQEHHVIRHTHDRREELPPVPNACNVGNGGSTNPVDSIKASI